MNLAYITWNFSPSVIPSLDIPRWYGIMWALGFYLGFLILNKMYKSEKVPESWMDKTFMYVLIGAILGARLGHLFFYEPWFDQVNAMGQVTREGFLSHPLSILKIWEGGLASHGGAIGIFVATYLLSKKVTKKHVLWVIDRIVVPTGLAGALIRLGNLFNHEIVGKETTSSIGFKFLRHDIGERNAMEWTNSESVQAGYDAIATNPDFSYILDTIPIRYPAQLIEAIAYLFIFLLMFFLYWKTNAGKLQGFLTGMFFMLVFGARFLIEYLKIPQGGTDLGLGMLNTGQKLSIPLVLLGLFLIIRKLKELKHSKNN